MGCLLELTHDAQRLVGRAGHFNGGAVFAVARAAQDNTGGRDDERMRAVKISRSEFDRAAEAVDEWESGDGIDGGLNGGGVVGAGGRDGALGGDGGQRHAAAFVAGVREVGDAIALGCVRIHQLAVRPGVGPVALRREGGGEESEGESGETRKARTE